MRPPEEFNVLLLSIYNCRSMTVIDMTIDQNLLDPKLGASQQKFLKDLKEANDLDVIYLKCAEVLGMDKEAQELRVWIEQKQKRKPLTVEDSDGMVFVT